MANQLREIIDRLKRLEYLVERNDRVILLEGPHTSYNGTEVPKEMNWLEGEVDLGFEDIIKPEGLTNSYFKEISDWFRSKGGVLVVYDKKRYIVGADAVKAVETAPSGMPTLPVSWISYVTVYDDNGPKWIGDSVRKTRMPSNAELENMERGAYGWLRRY